MGYVAPRRARKLIFAEDDEDMQGLVVRCNSVPLADFLEIASLTTVADSDPGAAASLKIFDDLLERFASVLVEWNVEDADGDPIPTTVAGLSQHEFGWVLNLIKAWIQTIGDVAGPLPQPSSDGVPILEASIPMEPLVLNPAS